MTASTSTSTHTALRVAYVMSDSTGNTASRALQVGLDQFPRAAVREQRIQNVRHPADVARVMHMAKQTGGIVLFTIVDQELRATARTAASELGVKTIDLLEPLLVGLADWLGMEPTRKPGHAFDEKYFKRMAAIDFAQLHDDGKNPHELPKAHVILLGLSRVAKTPVCAMLATHRIRAANIPIVLGVPLPAELAQVDPRRVFLIYKDVKRLIEVRQSRLAHLGDHDSITSYIDEETVKAEVRHVQRLLDANPKWTRVDAGRVGVEDVAAKILELYTGRFSEEA